MSTSLDEWFFLFVHHLKDLNLSTRTYNSICRAAMPCHYTYSRLPDPESGNWNYVKVPLTPHLKNAFLNAHKKPLEFETWIQYIISGKLREDILGLRNVGQATYHELFTKANVWANANANTSRPTHKCCLETHPEFGGCCCKCRYRLRALKHYHEDPQISIPDGTWACIAFAFMEGEDIAYIGDFEHGICELFMPLPWSIYDEAMQRQFP